MKQKQFWIMFIILGFALGVGLRAQNPPAANTTPVQATQALYYTIPISSTAASGATTLTIPAPAPNLYNYVCHLALNGSNNNTGAVLTNAVTTVTNFNSFVLKFSTISANSNTYDWSMNMGTPSAGCAKSTSPGTATTFVSPSVTNWAFTWYGSYFQAP